MALRRLVPASPKFGIQTNDVNHFFENVEIGDMFVASETLDIVEVINLAGTNGFVVQYYGPDTEEYATHGVGVYKITGKRIEFKPVARINKVTYTMSSQVFDAFIHISIIAKHEDTVTVDGKNKKSNNKTATWELCLSKKFFDEKVSEHGGDPSWLINFWQDDGKEENITVVVPKRLEMYNEGRESDYFGTEQPETLLNVLRQKKYNLLLTDRTKTDGFFYDVDGHPLFRPIHFGYNLTGLTEEDYIIDKLAEHLRQQEHVKSVKIITVPAAYASFVGERAVEFTYIPASVKSFEFIVRKTQEGDGNIMNKCLGLEKFKKVQT